MNYQNRKTWFNVYKKFLRCRYRKVEFVYLGDKPTEQSLILSNHEGTDAPLSLEIYADFPIRFWGTAEMNSGLIKMYKYQTKVYYHEKKHWNLFLARLFCLLASPLTNIFYKGLNLISVYKDARLKRTITESIDTMKNDKSNIVVFPEISDEGYQKYLKGFYGGCIVLCDKLLYEGIDIKVFTCYFNKKQRKYYFNKPIQYSELKERFLDRKNICEFLVKECNNLADL